MYYEDILTVILTTGNVSRVTYTDLSRRVRKMFGL